MRDSTAIHFELQKSNMHHNRREIRIMIDSFQL